MSAATQGSGLEPRTRAFYQRAMGLLGDAGVPFLVGGAYASERYTGIERHTKDFDVFVRPRDRDRALAALAAAGYRTEVTFPHWLGKAFGDEAFVDVIYRSQNGVAEVDDDWFVHAVEGEVLGRPVRLVPAEEILLTKALVMDRERYDGADVAHLLRARGQELDWPRLLRRFGAHWRALLSHLVLFGYIYPSERARIPRWVMDNLLGRLRDELESPQPEERICYGTVISRAQYLIDVDRWGYRDARLRPVGIMTPDDVARTAAAIEEEG